MLTDSFSNLFCIALNSRPISRSRAFTPTANRFVINFKNHIVVATISLRGPTKEFNGIALLIFCLMRMPVNNHIDVVLYSGFYHSLQHILLAVFVIEVAPVIIPGFTDTHGKADNFNFHVPYHGIDCIFRIEGGSSIIGGTPVKAHAAHLHFGAVLDTFATAIDLALATRCLASLQFAILAHRSHTGRLHGSDRSRNKTHGKNAKANHFFAKREKHTSSLTLISERKFRLKRAFFHVI